MSDGDDVGRALGAPAGRHANSCVLCLAGPTASGKSAAAMALAADRPVEIISVDSAQVYRGMDIGTAKPDASERAAVPHHLIDVIEPTESYSAARFVADARRLIDEIRSRGRLPVLVGGTMLYFKALWKRAGRGSRRPMPRRDAGCATTSTARPWPWAGRPCMPNWRRSTR